MNILKLIGNEVPLVGNVFRFPSKLNKGIEYGKVLGFRDGNVDLLLRMGNSNNPNRLLTVATDLSTFRMLQPKRIKRTFSMDVVNFLNDFSKNCISLHQPTCIGDMVMLDYDTYGIFLGYCNAYIAINRNDFTLSIKYSSLYSRIHIIGDLKLDVIQAALSAQLHHYRKACIVNDSDLDNACYYIAMTENGDLYRILEYICKKEINNIRKQ